MARAARPPAGHKFRCVDSGSLLVSLHSRSRTVPGHLFRIYESSSFLGKRVWLGGVEVGSPLAQHDAVTALAGQLPAPVGPLARSADKKSCQLYVIT